MSFQLDEPKSGYVLPPAGTHVPRLWRLVDLGFQTSDKFKDRFGDPICNRQGVLEFELSKKLMDDGKPFTARLIINNLSLSLHERARFAPIVASLLWRKLTKADVYGKDRLGLEEILGKACLISIEHIETDQGFARAKITSVMALPEDTPEPKAFNKPVLFALVPGFDESVLASLSDWEREMSQNSEGVSNIRASGKEAARLKSKSTAEIVDDEIPDPKPRKRRPPTTGPDAFDCDDDIPFA